MIADRWKDQFDKLLSRANRIYTVIEKPTKEEIWVIIKTEKDNRSPCEGTARRRTITEDNQQIIKYYE